MLMTGRVFTRCFMKICLTLFINILLLFPPFFLQLADPSSFPAVIVEQMPHSHLLNYSGLTCDQPLRLGFERDTVDDITQLTGQSTFLTQVFFYFI